VTDSADASFFIPTYQADGSGLPAYFETIWTPELPEFHYPSGTPKNLSLNPAYDVRAKTTKLTGDWYIDDFIASKNTLELASALDVKFLHAPLHVKLNRDKNIEDKYYFFMPLERVDLLDREKSIFNISINMGTGKPATPEDSGLDSTYYDKIEKFVPKRDVHRDLFLCTELKKIVCSVKFRQEWESARLFGLTFTPLNSDFRYDPWEGFPA
jgi:hypothetical protein